MERQPPAAARSASAFVTGQGSAFGRVGGQAALAGALLALATVAWVATDLRMSGMDAGPGTNPGAFGFYVSTWVVMMVAMMLPSIAPMVLTYRDLQHERGEHGRSTNAGDPGLFLAGYLAVWAAAGLLGYAVLEAGRSLDGGLFAWDHAGRWTAAGVLLLAALYQVTPSKSACLARCRSRRGFLLKGWRDGHGGALGMGVEHGAWCLGCCWALMAALFALGAMSLAWMVLISALIAAERLLPWRALATTGIASLLAAVAIGVAAAPARVPMLTIPGSPAAMRAMDTMAGRTLRMGIARHMQMPEPTRMTPRTSSMPRR
jgi:predicted metal-binding membrane protein